MNLRIGILVILLLGLVLTDLWLYYRIDQRIKNTSRIVRILYWMPTLIFGSFFAWVTLASDNIQQYTTMAKLIWIFWTFFLIYFPKAVFILFDLLQLTCSRLFGTKKNHLQWIGITLSFCTVLLLIYGATIGKSKLEIKEQNIPFATLPEELDGLKIVHISDLHLGNWNDRTYTIEKMVKMINEQAPDIVVCSGDLVNNFADEMLPYISILQGIKSKYGNYAILGNHDYGDYSKWESKAARETNLALTKKYIRESGFDLLLNENRILKIGSDSLKIAGVENWGKPPFKQYGKLDKSMGKNSANIFTILISHDSSHFRNEVIYNSNINLTLSGHTHAAQMGIYTKNWHWSPSKFIYEEYDGLYQHQQQYLYVNRGIGFVGVPMRIGANPEITVLKLEHQK